MHDLKCNAKEVNGYIFQHTMNKRCGLHGIYLENNVCEFVQEVKYISVIIYSTMKTTINVIRKTRKIYLQDDFLCLDTITIDTYNYSIIICLYDMKQNLRIAGFVPSHSKYNYLCIKKKKKKKITFVSCK